MCNQDQNQSVTYSKQHSAVNNRKFIQRKLKLGWRRMSCITPPEVYASILEHKHKEMLAWRIKHLQSQLN